MSKSNLLLFGWWCGFTGLSLAMVINMCIDGGPAFSSALQGALTIWGVYNARRFYLRLLKKDASI